MGYELRLVLGYEWTYDTTIGGQYPHTIHKVAEIDLSSPGYDSRIYKLVGQYQTAQAQKLNAISTSPASRKRRNASTMLYTDVLIGNRERNLFVDKYDRPLVSIPIQEIRDAIAADQAEHTDGVRGDFGYRRFYVALALIDALIATFPARIPDADVLAVNPLAGQLVAIPWGH